MYFKKLREKVRLRTSNIQLQPIYRSETTTAAPANASDIHTNGVWSSAREATGASLRRGQERAELKRHTRATATTRTFLRRVPQSMLMLTLSSQSTRQRGRIGTGCCRLFHGRSAQGVLSRVGAEGSIESPGGSYRTQAGSGKITHAQIIRERG